MIGLTLFAFAFAFGVLAIWAAVYGVTLWHERRERRRRGAAGVRIASWLRDGISLGEAIQGKRRNER